MFKNIFNRRYACVLLALLSLLATAPITTIVNAENEPYKVVGYFIQWGMYARNYRVKDIVKTGAADKLTHINYAFANVSTDYKCYEETRAGWGDSSADYLVSYNADQSVDGVADEVGQPVKGHFNQLRKLKTMYPKLKVLISLGGWTWSGRFSGAALPENREAFVKSCIDLFIRGNLPMWAYTSGTPPVQAAIGQAFGIFDGIDIDWEYPGVPAFEGDPSRSIPPHVYRAEDTENFVALLAEFRKQLDAVGKETGKHYLLTIAAPAGKSKYEKMALDKIHPYLDFINIMAYDMHGTWDAKGPTNFQAPLFSSPDDPDSNRLSVDSTVTEYLATGIPSQKLVMGVPFYGRGWTNVPNANNGLFQTGDKMKAARATYEDGIEDYRELKKLKYPSFRDPKTQAFWIFDGETFWNYDDEQVIAAKMKYIKDKSLGGTMFWSLDGDDGTLIKTISDNLK
jgi:chitinase